MKAILRSGFLALAIMAHVVPANAVTERFGPFIYYPLSPKDLTLDGPIDLRSALNFRRAFDAHPEIERLYLDSGGGSVQIALIIADDVHRARISTFIGRSSRCYSACAYIFFAGKIRQVDGRLGVHQLSGSGPANEESLQVNLSDVVEALNKYGVDPEVLEHLLRTSAGEMHIFTQQEIARLGLNRTSQIALTLEDAEAAYDRGDYATALRVFRPLAEQDDADAQNGLGVMYRNGLGVPQDFAEAVKWFRMAAERGYAKAQFSLGGMYRYGLGVPQDYSEAAKWIRRDAEQGHAEAQIILGKMYYQGEGVPQDLAEAVKWYRLAADQGITQAQYDLGQMYKNGWGVPQDVVLAHFWISLASAKFGSANTLLFFLAKRMTPGQIAEAQRMAREWMAKHQQ